MNVGKPSRGFQTCSKVVHRLSSLAKYRVQSAGLLSMYLLCFGGQTYSSMLWPSKYWILVTYVRGSMQNKHTNKSPYLFSRDSQPISLFLRTSTSWFLNNPLLGWGVVEVVKELLQRLKILIKLVYLNYTEIDRSGTADKMTNRKTPYLLATFPSEGDLRPSGLARGRSPGGADFPAK